MTEFKREERYIVVKLKDLSDVQAGILNELIDSWHIPERYCVVVESDWPIYEQTWDAVQRWAEGRGQRIAELEAERDGWMESARHFSKGQEFYQGIVRRIGELFGEVARISDDGSVQEDVLALKVPELVKAERDQLREQNAALAAHVERCNKIIDSWGDCEISCDDAALRVADWRGDKPDTSLARIQAEAKVEALDDLLRNDIGTDWEGDEVVWPEDIAKRIAEYRKQA